MSSGVTQLGPAVDRLYLSSAGAGSISSYEMSDRLMYAASQLYTMTFIYRRVAIWAQLPTMDAERARRLLRGDARSLGGLALLLTAGGAGACLAALVSGLLPADWHTGFWWGVARDAVAARPPVQRGRHPATRDRPQAAPDAVDRGRHRGPQRRPGRRALPAARPGRHRGVTVAVRWIMAGVYLYLLRTVVPATVGRELATD